MIYDLSLTSALPSYISIATIPGALKLPYIIGIIANSLYLHIIVFRSVGEEIFKVEKFGFRKANDVKRGREISRSLLPIPRPT